MKAEEPILIKAGDKRVRLNGVPPKVDCRVLAEETYQRMKAENKKLIDMLDKIQAGINNYFDSIK